MEGDLQQRMMQTLKQAISWAEAKQNKLLAQVLNIQKKINNLHETKTRLRKKQAQQVVKDQIKQETAAIEFQKKIDQMISKTQEQIQQIDNPNKKPKNAVNKNKFVQPLPQIDKKPPISTVNRAKDPQIVTYKPNYHYRNKNQVTGKITQTPIQKGTNKNSNSLAKKQENQNIFHQSAQKFKNTSQKVIKQEKTVNNNKNPISKSPPRKQINSMDNKDNKQAIQKGTYVDFSTFKVPINNLIQKAEQKNNKKGGSKKQVIENLISQFNKNEMGYKNNENKAMNSFLNSFNKLSATRSCLPLSKGLMIESRKRQAHLKTFNFQNLLDSFQTILNNNPISEEYNMNPKQAHRIKCWYQRLTQIFENQIQNTRVNLKLPPKLGFDFQMNNNENQSQFLEEKSQEALKNPFLIQFESQLYELLKQLKNLQNFDKDSLKKLRVLISIGLYEGKRSPVLIQSNKYDEWKQYYQT